MSKKSWDWGIDLGGTKCECVVLEGDEVCCAIAFPPSAVAVTST